MHQIIKAESIGFSYDKRKALSNTTFELSEGQTLAIVGPNGSGKSTLLLLLAKLNQASVGTLEIACKHPSLVQQTNHLNYAIPITVNDVVAMGRYPSVGLVKRFSSTDTKQTQLSLERLEIADLADRQLSELSGGQQQRTAVAQALNQQSELLLLDEPVNGLDVTSRDLILSALDEEKLKGVAVVVTTHNLEEASLCDRVLLLNQTQIAFGEPDEVLTVSNLKTAFGKDFNQIGDQMVIDHGHHH